MFSSFTRQRYCRNSSTKTNQLVSLQHVRVVTQLDDYWLAIVYMAIVLLDVDVLFFLVIFVSRSLSSPVPLVLSRALIIADKTW